MVYFDHAATTAVSPSVLEAMKPWLEWSGNPGSAHRLGRLAKAATEKAREQTAAFLGAKPEQIIFTSGGSEANSLMVYGLSGYLDAAEKRHILIFDGEHQSLRDGAISLAVRYGFKVDFIPSTREGRADMESLERFLREGVGAVFVMCVNNETGSINPIQKIARVCHKHGALFGTDLVQTAGYFPLRMEEIGCDFATISSHKIHGPKGAGALYARDTELLGPLIYGGSAQEHGLRGGTENVPALVGFGAACEAAGKETEKAGRTALFYKTTFIADLIKELKKGRFDTGRVAINGSDNFYKDCGKILNIRIDGVDGESLVLAADAKEMMISSGSACHEHASEPSRVLLSMGLTETEARQSVRVSFDSEQSIEEIEEGARTLASAIISLDRINGIMKNENIEIE